MHPVLTTLSWHGVTRPIGSYGAMLVLALGCGCALMLRAAARVRVDVGAVISAQAGAIGAGCVGAYACSVLVLWPQLGSLAEAMLRPGIVFYGGILSGAAGLAWFARRFGLPVLATLDLALPALPIAHAVGRIGCWFGGCCYGTASALPWAVHYPGDDVARHPWPLYEGSGLLLLAAVFAKRSRFALRPGRRAALYLASYALLRLPLEALRGDRVRGLMLQNLSVSQLLSLVVLLAACLFLRFGASRQVRGFATPPEVCR